MWFRRCHLLRWGRGFLFAALFSPLAMARANVVMNEIYYNAPEDAGDLQWIEIHNTGNERVDLGGWTVDQGKVFSFPVGAAVDGDGYVIVASDPEAFRKAYGMSALGSLKRPLKRGGETLELRDAEDRPIDRIRYDDRDPWPTAADGASASLERICPAAPGDSAANWTASPMPADRPKASGSPGKRNASYATVPPPVISEMTVSPGDPQVGQAIAVAARVTGSSLAEAAGGLTEGDAIRGVRLRYRTVVNGVEGEEASVPMTRDDATGKFRAAIPALTDEALLRYRIEATGASGARRVYPSETDLRPALSAWVHKPWKVGRIPFVFVLRGGPDRTAAAATGDGSGRTSPGLPGPTPGGRPFARGTRPYLGFREAPDEPRPPRGSSTFLYVDPGTGKIDVHDFAQVRSRDRGPISRGFIVHFPKDHPFRQMTAINLVYEGSQSFLLAEDLSYDLYHRTGHAAPLSEFVDVWMDGRITGCHLIVERPNRSFLRRNRINDKGNLYKLAWYGRDLVGQHEKKTNVRTGGHVDLIEVVEKLRSTRGDAQWEVIRTYFDVPQVANYFAVAMVLSHWDGFFNNYFAYHDTGGTGKWQLYPWDQDKTWGYYDGIPDDEVFTTLPLEFGMDGPMPSAGGRGLTGRPDSEGFGSLPGGGADRLPGGFGGPRGRIDGGSWWRPPGVFSGPLLANPPFRRVFLDRVREIINRIYTKENYFPVIDRKVKQLKEDAEFRAVMEGEDPETGSRNLAYLANLLKTHLVERRQFLLEHLNNSSGAPSPDRNEASGAPSPARNEAYGVPSPDRNEASGAPSPDRRAGRDR